MSSGAGHAMRRAERLLRWYPTPWRQRYGEEFRELLAADIEERPTAFSRTIDVARMGLLTRLSFMGLAGCARDVHTQMRATLGILTAAVGAFLFSGLAIWSHLAVGWRWSTPDSPIMVYGMIIMLFAMAYFVLLLCLAAAPLVWCAARDIKRDPSPRLVLPAMLILGLAAVLFAGSRQFEAGWPGAGGKPWSGQGIVPPGIASFCWSMTLGMTSYWVHPHALSSFPTRELTWMAVSPLLIVAFVTGCATLVRRITVPPTVWKYEGKLSRVSAFGMGIFLTGACLWVVAGQADTRPIFHAGVIDIAGLALMLASMVLARQATRRAPNWSD